MVAASGRTRALLVASLLFHASATDSVVTGYDASAAPLRPPPATVIQPPASPSSGFLAQSPDSRGPLTEGTVPSSQESKWEVPPQPSENAEWPIVGQEAGAAGAGSVLGEGGFGPRGRDADTSELGGQTIIIVLLLAALFCVVCVVPCCCMKEAYECLCGQGSWGGYGYSGTEMAAAGLAGAAAGYYMGDGYGYPGACQGGGAYPASVGGW